MTETKIYVGLNDSETRRQEFETEKYASILKTVCRSYHVSFSFALVQGGYIHEDGGLHPGEFPGALPHRRGSLRG